MPEPVPSAAELGRQLGPIAVGLAEGAAAVVRDGRAATAGTLEIASKSTDTDLVTEIDRRAEQWLVAQVAARRPADGVLGEEGGAHPGTSGVRWVIDPIDGTVNFVLGIPHYAVSVAAELGTDHGDVVVAGAVCDVALGETFSATLGGGARLGTASLHGPRTVPLGRAVVGTGFGYDASLRTRQAAAIATVLPQVADIRRLGSAALALCYVAAGRLDAYFEAGLHPWDHAAGALIAAEAGCVVGDATGGTSSHRLTLAAGADLVGPLRALLAESGADRVL